MNYKCWLSFMQVKKGKLDQRERDKVHRAAQWDKLYWAFRFKF